MSGILLDYINYAMEIIFQEDIDNHKMNRTQVLFLSGGMFNIICDWIKRGATESPASLADKLSRILPQY